jgi:2-polyprenyl-3-methyl-5-hydroxy-6-metoxy-1,4-benzoquinol methylase
VTGVPSGVLERLVEAAGPCPVCGETRRARRYEGLRDWLGGTPGSWSFHGCRGCGLLLLDPRYSRSEIGRAYEGYEHHLAAPQPESDAGAGSTWGQVVTRAYRRHAYGYPDGLTGWLRALALLAVPYPEGAEAVGFSVMYLRPVPGGELLDVGCGGGAQLVQMRRLGWRVAGVDPDERAVAMATGQHGLDVRKGTLEEQRFPAARFDAVTLSHVIEHVHDPLALLRECGRVLKPGGRVVVVTPNAASLTHRRLGAAWIGLQPPRHLYLFRCATLRRLAARAGLTVLSARTSVRNAEFSWLLGRGALQTWPSPGQRPPRGWAGRRARAFQLEQWALTRLGIEAGEEIVMIATRS